MFEPINTESPRTLSMSGVSRRIEEVAVALRPYLPFVHIAMALAFVVLIAAPVMLPASEITREMGQTARFLIWTLWFPLVFLSVLVTGRLWCGVLCPMGAASEWMNGIGLKRKVPAWLRWEGTPIASFLIVTILGQTVGVRDYPSAILEVFGITLLAALAIGYFYGQGQRKRAWCRHACPIGLLLGVFSRLGPVDLVPKRPETGGDAYDPRGLCPTMIDLRRKTESRHCVMCARCVSPQKSGGLALRLRNPGAEIAEIGRHHPAVIGSVVPVSRHRRLARRLSVAGAAAVPDAAHGAGELGDRQRIYMARRAGTVLADGRASRGARGLRLARLPADYRVDDRDHAGSDRRAGDIARGRRLDRGEVRGGGEFPRPLRAR